MKSEVNVCGIYISPYKAELTAFGTTSDALSRFAISTFF